MGPGSPGPGPPNPTPQPTPDQDIHRKLKTNLKQLVIKHFYNSLTLWFAQFVYGVLSKELRSAAALGGVVEIID